MRYTINIAILAPWTAAADFSSASFQSILQAPVAERVAQGSWTGMCACTQDSVLAKNIVFYCRCDPSEASIHDPEGSQADRNVTQFYER